MTLRSAIYPGALAHGMSAPAIHYITLRSSKHRLFFPIVFTTETYYSHPRNSGCTMGSRSGTLTQRRVDQAGNKELCDLLVVMSDDVIVFFDKHCILKPNKSLEVDWQRWFRSAVAAGASQAWGAERWLRNHPDRVFLDPACTQHCQSRCHPPNPQGTT